MYIPSDLACVRLIYINYIYSGRDAGEVRTPEPMRSPLAGYRPGDGVATEGPSLDPTNAARLVPFPVRVIRSL